MPLLQTGDLAPDFASVDFRNRPVRLADYRGRKLLLCFYRYAGCPFCNFALSELIRNYRALQAGGLQVIAFFQSPPSLVARYPGLQRPPFPVVADPDREIYGRYGVTSSRRGTLRSALQAGRFIEAVFFRGFPQPAVDGDFFLMPAEFLIGPDQTVQKARYWRHFADNLPMKDIRRFLEPVRQAA